MKKISPSRRPAKARRERTDLYQQVTDKIIAAIETGTLPWRNPWRTDKGRGASTAIMPQNGTTGYHYSGVNVLLLWMAADERGFHSNRWLTYKQAEAVGGHVRAGETATLAVVFKPWDKQVEDADGRQLFDEEGKPLKTRIPMLKPLYLFNVAQCDNLPETVIGVMPATETDEGNALVDAKTQAQVNTLVEACGVRVEQVYQDRAFYSPLRDQIVLPQAQQFRTEADYWSTLLHELVHSTGHAKRLNREGITSSSRRFGDPVYAFEELVAELGSAFMCAQLGVFGDIQHDSYLEHWLRVLREDKRALFRAAKQAREASEFLLKPLADPVTTDPAVAA
ncbi:ArdC family protein [Serratia marcescens]|uniref:ArdC family protein n=1 Tax=Serratia marcescens TaxID=615 RepID=UPI000D734735|nr:zincin-like metallopeptidase domain-containing protein [Serratia marcescens]AWO77454.1 DNA primase [Serratia marcescens]